MSEPLLPCPFCGKQPDSLSRFAITTGAYGKNSEQWACGCRTCGVLMVGAGQYGTGAIAAWNTRHQPEPTPEQVERVASALKDADYAWGDPSVTEGLHLHLARSAIKAMKAQP